MPPTLAHAHSQALCMSRVGQDLCIYGVYTVIWQGNHQIYGHMRCIYKVLANPVHEPCVNFNNALWYIVEEAYAEKMPPTLAHACSQAAGLSPVYTSILPCGA